MYAGNVKQVLNVSQIFALKMIQDKIGGAIVNISSQVGTFYPPPPPPTELPATEDISETTYKDVVDHSSHFPLQLQNCFSLALAKPFNIKFKN